MQSLLIKDTTRAQREEIVRRALAACGGSCEGCNGCGLQVLKGVCKGCE